MESAIKVGIFVVAFFVLLGLTYVILQRSLFAEEVDSYFVEFTDAGGLTEGAPVMLAGVQVGQVDRMFLVDPSTARAVIAIKPGTRIPVGTQALVPGTLVSLGGQQIKLVAPSEFQRILEPGSVIPGRQKGVFEEVLPNTEQLVAQLEKTMQSLQAVLEDEELLGGIKDVTTEAGKTIEKYGDLAVRLDGVVAQSGNQFQDVLASTQTSLQNLEAVTLEVRELVESGEIQEGTVALLESMDSAVANAAQLVDDLQALVSDPQLRGSLDRTLANVEEATATGVRVAQNAEVITENGAVVSEEAIVLMQKANALADEINKLVQDVRGALTDLTGTAASLLPEVVGLEFEGSLVRETEPDRTRVDLMASVPIGEDERVNLGFYDAFESNKLILQLDRSVSDYLDLRYGIYASKPGVGVDYLFSPQFEARANAYGLNDTKLDFRLSYMFQNGFWAWLGVEGILDRNAPAAGITIRR